VRSYQVFAAMSQEQAERFLRTLSQEAPSLAAQALAAAGAAMKARPVYLRRLPLERRATAVRRALARVGSNALAEELLAAYFLECRRPLLVEWLDRAGVAHEDGTLRDETPAPPGTEALAKAVATFLEDAGPEPGARGERELLLRSFAAQGAVDWPDLEALLAEGGEPRPGR